MNGCEITVNLTRSVVGLQISIREYGEIIILDLKGRSTIDSDESKLLLNLTNLTQVDSTGVGVIVKTYVSLRDQGGTLKLLCPCGRVREVLKVTRLLETIPSFEDEPQALSSFRPLSRFAWP